MLGLFNETVIVARVEQDLQIHAAAGVLHVGSARVIAFLSELTW